MTRARTAAATVAVSAALWVAAPAGAHIQVTPVRVAPSDPVMFTVLVPNERNATTSRVELDIPRSVIPFGFESAPGWRRRIERNPDQSVRSVVWTGTLPEAGFAQFRLLGTTPPDPGAITWRARQVYADGTIVRWEGRPGSESPASVVAVDQDAPRQNAGGEGMGGPPRGGSGGADRADVDGADPAATSGEGSSRRDDALTIAGVVLGGGALLVAVLALVLAGRRAVDRAAGEDPA